MVNPFVLTIGIILQVKLNYFKIMHNMHCVHIIGFSNERHLTFNSTYLVTTKFRNKLQLILSNLTIVNGVPLSGRRHQFLGSGQKSSTATVLAQNFRTLSLDMWGASSITNLQCHYFQTSHVSCRIISIKSVQYLCLQEAFTKDCNYSAGHKSSAHKLQYMNKNNVAQSCLILLGSQPQDSRL